MTTFPCFASTFDFFNNPAVADVATIITDFRARVTGQTPPWTEPVAGTFQSPVDGVGRFMQVTLTRNSATNLAFILTDQNAINIVNRSINIDVVPTGVNYYTGQFHAYIETLPATPEIGQAGILDETPQAQNAILDYVFGNALRNSGGAVDGGGGTVNLLQMLDNGVLANANRFRSWAQTPAALVNLKDPTGALEFFPADTQANAGGSVGWIGRCYQVYLCDASLPFGTQKTIKIGDAGETGVFQVIGLATQTGMREMVRVA